HGEALYQFASSIIEDLNLQNFRLNNISLPTSGENKVSLYDLKWIIQEIDKYAENTPQIHCLVCFPFYWTKVFHSIDDEIERLINSPRANILYLFASPHRELDYKSGRYFIVH